MYVSNRKKLLGHFDVWLEALHRLNGYIVRLTPYGVYAIAAFTAGTMTLEEIGRLHVYLSCYTAAILLLTFVVLPAIVTSCTPFSYRDMLNVTSSAMITAFATGKLIVVLPLLIDRTTELFRKYGHHGEEVEADIDVVYPLAYPIPNLGKLLTLLFVPFVGWFAGTPLSMMDYPALLTIGSVAYFGKPIIAMPFLLTPSTSPLTCFNSFWCLAFTVDASAKSLRS